MGNTEEQHPCRGSTGTGGGGGEWLTSSTSVMTVAEEKRRRNTVQRQVVLEELRNLAWHPTAAELYELARRRVPKISLATVYRNLEVLAQMGVIRKVMVGGAETRFDGDVDRHYHVCCVHCGRVDDARGAPDDLVKGDVESLNGYEIVGFRLHFLGICPACRGGRDVRVLPDGALGVVGADGRDTVLAH